MDGDKNSDKVDNQKRIRKALISVGLQVGVLTLVVIFASLVIGLLLDQIFDALPLFTIIFLVVSMPVTWVLVFRVVNRAKDQLITGIKDQKQRSE